jgi:putative hemolysin
LLDPDSTAPIIILVVLLAFHAFFAAVKEAIVSIRKARRLQLIEQGKPSAQVIDRLAEDATHLLATEQLALKSLGFFIIAFAAFIYTAPLAQAISVSNFTAVIIITVISVFIILVFGELIPKEIARSYAEPMALWSIYPFNLLSRLTAPLAQVVTKTGRIVTGRWNEVEENSLSTITEEDLRIYVDAGEEGGLLKEDEKEMIYSIFDLDDTLAREIMVPRIDIVAVEANTLIREAMDIIIQAGHSRVPVYVDTVDNIIGILYVKDLLAHWLKEGEPRSVRNLEREVYYVPETKPVNDLLRELQAKKVHIAIVVDEYGGTAGLVTIEDVLEEIVGEIQDEHDAEEFYMQYISDDEYIFSARMDLDDINDLMSIDLPTDESDTLGGLIYNVLGRIPKAGDALSGESFGLPNLYLTVLAVDGRRIRTVKVKRVNEGNSQTKDLKTVIGKNPSTLMNNAPNTVSETP